MIFNVKKRSMKSIVNNFLILGFYSLIGSSAHADLVQLDVRNSEWGGAAVQSAEVYNESTSSLVIAREDYAKINIKPLYRDSVIVYNSVENTFMETREFSNNVVMYYFHSKNGALILDRDNEDPIKNSWEVRCTKDRITDEKNCFISKYSVGIWKSSKYGFSLMISTDIKNLNYSRYSYIRVDENPAHRVKGSFEGQAALNIVNQMKRGQIAYTRFNDWNGEQYEEELSLWGISAAYDVMNKIYAKLN